MTKHDILLGRWKDLDHKIETTETKITANTPLQISQLAHNIVSKGLKGIGGALRDSLKSVIEILKVPIDQKKDMYREL